MLSPSLIRDDWYPMLAATAKRQAKQCREAIDSQAGDEFDTLVVELTD